MEGIDQDWELFVADSERVSEFFAAYDDPTLSDEEREELMRLILASLDGYVRKHGQPPETWPAIKSALIRDRPLHAERIDYWACRGEWALEGEEDSAVNWFALTPLMRQL